MNKYFVCYQVKFDDGSIRKCNEIFETNKLTQESISEFIDSHDCVITFMIKLDD